MNNNNKPHLLGVLSLYPSSAWLYDSKEIHTWWTCLSFMVDTLSEVIYGLLLSRLQYLS